MAERTTSIAGRGGGGGAVEGGGDDDLWKRSTRHDTFVYRHVVRGCAQPAAKPAMVLGAMVTCTVVILQQVIMLFVVVVSWASAMQLC